MVMGGVGALAGHMTHLQSNSKIKLLLQAYVMRDLIQGGKGRAGMQALAGSTSQGMMARGHSKSTYEH